MKILSKKLKYYAGLAFAIVLVASTFVSVTPPQPVSASNHCPTGYTESSMGCIPPGGGMPSTEPGCPAGSIAYRGACVPRSQPNSDGSCPEGTQPGGPLGGCIGEAVGTPTPGGGGRQGAPCPGSNAPAGTDCSTIPAPCPGSSRNQGTTIGPGQNDPSRQPQTTGTVQCPYESTSTSWSCQVDECVFPSGTLTKGQGGTPGNPTGAGVAAMEETELDCDMSINPLTWIVCPVIKLVNATIVGLDAAIVGMLTIEQEEIFNDTKQPGKGYRQAWETFRNIALGILIIGALVMLIGQALGFDFLDAYTIKKVLPRLIIAIIGIALSWELMRFLVVLTNDLGLGIRQLIIYPFMEGNVNGNDPIIGGGEATIIALLTSAAFIPLGLMGILSFGATALLALFIAFMVLVLRQIIIIILILMAPIAIACYILPNTQNIWKIWNESFEKALLMFPIIMAFIAVGRVMSMVASGDQASFVGQLVAFIAYIIPYFLIPLTFRFAGGALRTLGGFVNDNGRGGFDRLKKYRGAKAKDRVSRAQSDSLWDPNSKIGRAGNKIAGWATDPGSNLAYAGRNTRLLGKKGRAVETQITRQRIDQSGKLFEELNKSGYNDKAYRALTGHHSAIGADGKPIFSKNVTDQLREAKLLDKVPQTVSELQTMANILGSDEDANTRIAASAIQGSTGRLATLYQDPEMNKASIQAAGIMGLASHGFADGNDLAYVGNKLQEKGGQGYAQSVISQAQVMGARSRPDIKAGYGIVYKDGKFLNGMNPGTGDPKDSRAHGLVKTLNSQDLAAAKGGAFDTLKPEIIKTLKAEYGDGEAQAVKDQLFQWASPYSSASVDIKAKALEMINTPPPELAGLKLKEEFERRTRMETEAEIARRGGPGALPGAGGGGDAT